MAQQVGNGYTINLTTSLRAGTKALEELRLQGHISTTNWNCLCVGPIDPHPVNNPIGRVLTFIFEGNQRVEVAVATFKSAVAETVLDFVCTEGKRRSTQHFYIITRQIEFILRPYVL